MQEQRVQRCEDRGEDPSTMIACELEDGHEWCSSELRQVSRSACYTLPNWTGLSPLRTKRLLKQELSCDGSDVTAWVLAGTHSCSGLLDRSGCTRHEPYDPSRHLG